MQHYREALVLTFWCCYASSIEGLCNVQHGNSVCSADFQALLSPRNSEPYRCTCINEHDARHRLRPDTRRTVK